MYIDLVRVKFIRGGRSVKIQLHMGAELDEIIVDHVCIDDWHLRLVFVSMLKQPGFLVQEIYTHIANVVATVKYEEADESVGCPGGWYLDGIEISDAPHATVDHSEVRELVEQWVEANQSMFDEEAKG